MIILSTLRYGEEAYGSASKAMLKKLEPTHNRGIRLALNTTITAIRFISNPNHPIRPYCLNPTKLDEYALRQATPKPLFVRAMEHLGKLQIDTRKIEAHHRTLDHHGETSAITDSITNYAKSNEAQATKDTKLKLFAPSTKNTNITAKYIPTDRKKTKRLDT
jgi:hypothetical protein